MAEVLKVAICAEAFGFGPASKASSILSRLKEASRVEATILTNSVSEEYFKKEGYSIFASFDIRSQDTCDLEHLIDKFDIALVVMLPEWLSFFHERVPVVYVDSLGFMWPRSYFEEHPLLSSVSAYVVQDIFNATERVDAFGIKNIHSVGALVPELPCHHGAGQPVVHLGGGINIFSSADGPLYASFAARLINGIVPSLTSVLVSNSVLAYQPDFLDFVPKCLTHRDAVNAFAQAPYVFTSPGLTGLLELAVMKVPTIPLPPQNQSQALIIKEMALLDGASPTWSFLADRYYLHEDLPEEEGVAAIRGLNILYKDDMKFLADYQKVVREELDSPTTLPRGFAQSVNGLDEILPIIGSIIKNKIGKK